MSAYATHGTQKALQAAAALSVNRFMERETAENLRVLREQMNEKEQYYLAENI